MDVFTRKLESDDHRSSGNDEMTDHRYTGDSEIDKLKISATNHFHHCYRENSETSGDKDKYQQFTLLGV